MLATIAIEYTSEMSKISRGIYTDTFSPYAATNLLTVPISLVHSDWSGYPIEFNAELYRSLARHAIVPVLLNVVLETALIMAATILLVIVIRRSRSRPNGH